MDVSESKDAEEDAKASPQGEEKTTETNATTDKTNDTSRDANVAVEGTQEAPAGDESVGENSNTRMEDASERKSGKGDNDEASLGTTQTDIERRMMQEDTEEEMEAGSKTNNKKERRKSNQIPHYVDEETLKLIKDSLNETTEKSQVLDDDEIVARMYRADRNVEQRMRYESNPIDDIDAVDEARRYRRMYREEEEYLVGHDFLKEIQNEAQESRKILDKRTLNWVKRAAGLNKSHLHHPHAKQFHNGDAVDSPIGGVVKGNAPRRYTRGMARNTRIKKKEERIFKENLGLKCLLDAVEALEPICGPYPIPVECVKARNYVIREAERSRDSAISRQHQHHHSESSTRRSSNNRREPHGGPMPVPLLATIPAEEREYLRKKFRLRNDSIFDDVKDVLLTQILVSGIHVEEDDVDNHVIKQRKKELKRMRDRQYHKRRRDEKQTAAEQRRSAEAAKFLSPQRNKNKRPHVSIDDSDEEEDHSGRKRRRHHQDAFLRSGAAPISLRLLDWQRRQQALDESKKKTKIESERDVRKRLQVPLALAKLGVGFRLPSWESVKPSRVHDPKLKLEPLRGRHSDDIYASWCHKLINCLSGCARAWATHEFFYSDIDRAWFNDNTFARDVAKLGIPPSTRLTRREWSAIRRFIPNRPRLFSKRFIFSQLRERNIYRNQVRQRQRNPDLINDTGYDIPASIRVGATVTAFNKKFLIIHRGIVLFHDTYSSRYLVQFERKELGYEFCHDTEVASHGLPEVLIPGSEKLIADSNIFDTDSIQYGTSHGPWTGVESTGEVTCQSQLASILTGSEPAVASDDSGGLSKAGRRGLVEKVAERETLVSLMSTIDAAVSRKAMILDAMEKFNVLLVDRLPFGEGPPSNHVISGYFEKHYAWLRANLELTNRCLETALIHLKVMYSQAYTATPSSTVVINEDIHRQFVQTVIRECSDSDYVCGRPFVSQHWMDALFSGSQEVGKQLAALVCTEKLCDGINFTNWNKPANGDKHATLTTQKAGNGATPSLAAAVDFLSTVSYIGDRSTENSNIFTSHDESPSMIGTALEGCHRTLLRTANTENVSWGRLDHLVKEVLDDRAAAEKELTKALNFLQAELSALDAVNRV